MAAGPYSPREMLLRGVGIAAVVAAAIGLADGAARADPTPEPAAEPPPAPVTTTGDDGFERFLTFAAADSHRGRMLSAAVNAALGAIEIPLGVVLTTRSDPGVGAVGVTVTTSGALSVVRLLQALPFPCPMEVLRDHYEARRRSGQSPAVARAETEKEWQAAASRPDVGAWLHGADLTIASAMIAGGSYLLLADPGVANMSRRDQTAWAAVLLGVALPAAAQDLYHLLGASSLVTWWDEYRSVQGASPRADAPGVLSSASFLVVPFQRGAAGVVSAAF